MPSVRPRRSQRLVRDPLGPWSGCPVGPAGGVARPGFRSSRPIRPPRLPVPPTRSTVFIDISFVIAVHCDCLPATPARQGQSGKPPASCRLSRETPAGRRQQSVTASPFSSDCPPTSTVPCMTYSHCRQPWPRWRRDLVARLQMRVIDVHLVPDRERRSAAAAARRGESTRRA